MGRRLDVVGRSLHLRWLLGRRDRSRKWRQSGVSVSASESVKSLTGERFGVLRPSSKYASSKFSTPDRSTSSRRRLRAIHRFAVAKLNSCAATQVSQFPWPILSLCSTNNPPSSIAKGSALLVALMMDRLTSFRITQKLAYNLFIRRSVWLIGTTSKSAVAGAFGALPSPHKNCWKCGHFATTSCALSVFSLFGIPTGARSNCLSAAMTASGSYKTLLPVRM